MLTWREVYHGEMDRVRRELTATRSDLSYWQIDSLAIREAERLVNLAINMEIEQARKAGRSADLN